MARGRKPLPIERYIDKLEQAILIGATYEIAAQYAGISERTFQTWRMQAQDAPEGTPLALLRERLKQAEGRAVVGWLAKIEKAASEGNWQAAAWKLERRHPEQYGREPVRKVAFTTPDGEEPWEPMVVYLPQKAPSAEQWAQDVAHLRPQTMPDAQA